MFVCNSSFSLQTELSAPPPGLGPFPSPLLGGFPGASLLIGQHAASLHLAQLKTQLALTQINSALAVGSQSRAFKANSKTRARCRRSAAPSPTAVAINLLNILKIANMSHPPYNPCGSGKQRSAQRQYAYSNTQPETARLGADSSFSSSAIPERPGTIVPSLTSLNYRHGQRRIVNDEPILRSAITNSTRDREVRPAGILVPQTNQNALFPGRDTGEIGPFGTNKASFQMSSSSSAFQGDRGTSVNNDRCSMDWLNYKRPTNQSTSATLLGEEHNAPYIPGLGDDSYTMPEERSAAPPSSQTRNTAETATSILRQYGLDKEDLEYLISCPEDQMTLANMQKILQQRSLEKANKTIAASHTKTYSEPQPLKSLSGPSSHSSSVGPGLSQKKRSPAVLQQSKVIDYGHKRRYNEGALDGVGTTADGTPSSSHSGGTFLLDSGHSGGSRLQPQEKNKRGTNSESSGSLHIPGLNTLGPYNKPLQTPKKVPSTMLVPKTDTDMRKSKKAVPVKEPEEVGQSLLKPTTSCILMHGMHSGRPGLINDNKSHSIKAKQDQAPTVGNLAGQHPLAQQSQPPMPTEPLLRTVVWSSGYSASLQLPPATHPSRISEPSWAAHHSSVIPPHLHQPFPAQAANPEEHTQGKATPFKGLPTLAMMHDYAATSPRVFPHTCSLCSKECAGMKVSRTLHFVVYANCESPSIVIQDVKEFCIFKHRLFHLILFQLESSRAPEIMLL